MGAAGVRPFFTDVVLALRFFLVAFAALSATATLSTESLRALSPQMFSSKAVISASIRFCSLVIAESVGQYCASVLPSMLLVLYILPRYMFFAK